MRKARAFLRRFSKTRFCRVGVTVFLLVFLFVAVTQILKRETFGMSAGEVSLQMTPAIPGGDVIVPLGPLGELSWEAHRAPLNIEASLIVGSNAKEIPVASELTRLPQTFVFRKLPWLLFFGALLAIPAAIKSKKKFFTLITVSVLPSLMFGSLFIITTATFDESAFDSPKYRGPIEDAPRVLELVKDIQGDWPTFRERVDETVRGIYALHNEITADYNPTKGNSIRFLVVSDLHSNFGAFSLMKSLAKNFSVNAVLDAGDHVTLGWEQETYLFPVSLRVPYIITPGNHESETAVRRLSQEGARILESGKQDIIVIDGIKILGDRDPNSYDSGTDTPTDEALTSRCEKLLERFKEEKPNIVMVHHPKQAACIDAYAEENGMSVVIISGHMHTPHFKQSEYVINFSPGTSGAGGVKITSPYGFAILEFRRDTLEPSYICLIETTSPTALPSTDCDPLQK